MKKTSILLVLFLANVLLPLNVGAGTLLFSDGFENGSFSKWSTATSGVTITSSEKKSGAYSAQVSYYPTSLQALIKDVSSPPTSEFYFTYQIKIAPSFNAPYMGFKWARLKHGNVDGIQTEFYLKSEGWGSSGHSYQTGQSLLDNPGGNSWYSKVADGNWHKIAVYGKYNTNGGPNGICRIWIDGGLWFEKLTYTWRTGEFANDVFVKFYLPSNAGDGVHRPEAGDIVFIDDVEIWNGMPGAVGTPPPPPPPPPKIESIEFK